MPVSSLTVVGHIDPPEGKPWEEVIPTRRGQAHALLAFQMLTAKALSLPFLEVRVHRCVYIDGRGDMGMTTQGWHRDSAKKCGHVLCVLGDNPTHFLLGEYDEEQVEAGDWSGLQASLRWWQPQPGEAIWIDRYTLHRRPPDVGRTRMFMVGSER